MAAARTSLKLYWCSTPDHDEDWFVIARSHPGARKFHADAEGYDYDEVAAERVCVLPASLQQRGDELLGWPDEDVIGACGGEYLRRDPHIVRIGERVFQEGAMDSVLKPDHGDKH